MTRPKLNTTVAAAALLATFLSAAPVPASAGILDSLFGSEGTKATTDSRRKSWTINEYSGVRLVPREPGSTPNQHPLQIDRESLRQMLGQVRFEVRDSAQSLFAVDELAELSDPLSQALANAGPDEDVLLLSSSRRGAGLFSQPLAVTARVFVRDGALQFIVNDARYEFFNEMRGSNRAPNFTFGSRSKAGSVRLRSGLGTSPRPDWLALPVGAQAAAVASPAMPQPAGAVPSVAPAAVAPVVAPAAATAVPGPRDPNFANEVEQRLITLKRLRDKGLISEEEYQQKRREILSQL